MFRISYGALLLGGLLALTPVMASSADALPGEALPGVSIAVENSETGMIVAKGVTGPDGFVRVYNIPAGSYRVTSSNVAAALRTAATRAAKLLATRPVDAPTPQPSPTEPPPAVSPAVEPVGAATNPAAPGPAPGLAMPGRPAAVTVLLTGAGTSREARIAVTALVDGMEMVQFKVAVSGPVAVSMRHVEE